MSAPVFSLPDFGFEQVSFDLIVPRNVNRMEGRRTEGRVFGVPYWQAEYSVGYQTRRGMGQADAWIRKVMSRGGVFQARDEFRLRPIEAGDTPLTWTPDLTHITNGGRNVRITGAGSGFQFREGDYVAFRMTDLVVSLHSIAADAQSSLTSGIVTLEIDPLLDTQNFTVDAVPIFEKPYCLMQPNDWSAPKSWETRNPSFSAQEVFFYGT